jgi:hypothetical protein
MEVIVGLVELFSYWGALYAMAGTWWMGLTLRLMEWAERVMEQ